MAAQDNIRKIHMQAQEATRLNQSGELLYEDMQRAWSRFFEATEQILQDLKLDTLVAYISGQDPGQEPDEREHLILKQDLKVGEKKWRKGDSLCRPGEGPLELEPVDLARPANCINCLETAEKIVGASALAV